MATPEPDDPAAPTERVEPTAAATRAGRGGAPTRWVTRILRPGSAAPPERPGEADRTAALTTSVTHRGTPGAPPPSTVGPQPWWRRALGPVLAWFSRLVARVVVGPAGELDYAIPAELRRSYTVLGHVGSGGEAIVYLAEPAGEPGRKLALKVYRPGHDINRDLLDRLRTRGDTGPHVPAVHGYGHARSPWGEDLAWEAQEYFAEGSLRALLDAAPLPPDRGRDIVAGVADCLRHWQDSLQHNHTDVKPENLLIRDLDPPVFALTDFGGAVRATMSRVYGGLAITRDYAAPEVVEGRREAPAAWWSLGIMVHELVTGRRPDRGESWLTARSTDVDVSAIQDEEWRLLARGLLTLIPSGRWGYDHVRQWLAGERPQLASARRHAPIRFADVAHDDPPSLAFDLLDRSDKGEVWLRTHWPTVRTWLDREVNDYTFDRAYLTDLDAHPERVHLAISALAARFVPGMPPRYRGHEITAEGVLALAAGEQWRHGVLREAIETGALDLAARHWCDHPGCRDEGAKRCALLERAQHEVPLIMERVRATTDRLAGSGPSGAGGPLGDGGPPDHEWDTAWARAAELVLDSGAAARHRRLLRQQSWHPARRSDAPRAGWWREQRGAALRTRGGSGIETSAAVVTALLLLPMATRAGTAQRQRDRADSQERWRHRRQGLGQALAHGWARVRGRVAPPRGAPTGPGSPDGDPPFGSAGPHRDAAERARIDRGMRQIERAMTARRCRRYAYPVALLGLLDGLGRSLRGDNGYYPGDGAAGSAYVSLVDFSHNPVMTTISTAARSITGLLGDSGQWWYPVLLGAVLLLLGRTTASRRRKARTQLMARRLAVVGTALMVAVLLAGALVTLGAALLVPLDSLTG